MLGFLSLVRLPDAQRVRMIGPIRALNALLASRPHMVVIKGLIPLPHFIAYLPYQGYHLLSLRRIVQDALRLVLTWTLSKRFRLTVEFHRPVLVIHNCCRSG